MELKKINTNSTHSTMHFSDTDNSFVSYWVDTWYIYHASAADDSYHLWCYNTINVYIQKWKCNMTPMKAISLLEAGLWKFYSTAIVNMVHWRLTRNAKFTSVLDIQISCIGNELCDTLILHSCITAKVNLQLQGEQERKAC